MLSLRKIAKGRGLRQKDVAERLAMSEATVSKWFNRGATIPTQFIAPLAEMLGLEPADVLSVAIMLPPDAPIPEPATCPICGMLRAPSCQTPEAEAA